MLLLMWKASVYGEQIRANIGSPFEFKYNLSGMNVQMHIFALPWSLLDLLELITVSPGSNCTE